MTVDGVVQNYACVGQNITLSCDLDGTPHVWRTSITSSPTAILPGVPFNSDDPPFSYSLTSVSSATNFVTSAAVPATADLNGTVVSCEGPNDSSFLNATILILGSPSAPTVTTTPALDLVSFVFSITPPVYAYECILYYTISTTSSGPTMIDDFTIMANQTRQVLTMEMGRFNVCVCTYNFTALPVTRTGTGLRSEAFVQPPISISELLGSTTAASDTVTSSPAIPASTDSSVLTTMRSPVLNTRNSGYQVTLSWMVPITRVYNVSISRSNLSSSECVEPVGQVTALQGIQVPLDCTYTQQSVTFCARFSSFECSSDIHMVASPQLPRLLSLEQLTSSSDAVETISLFVSVTQHVECADMDLYQVNISIAQATHASRVVPLANTVVTLTNVPAGLHNCTATVWRNGIRIETTSIPCRSSESTTDPAASSSISALATAVIAVLAVVSVLTLLIGVVLGALFSRCCSTSWNKDSPRTEEVELTSAAVVAPPHYEDIDDMVFSNPAVDGEVGGASTRTTEGDTTTHAPTTTNGSMSRSNGEAGRSESEARRNGRTSDGRNGSAAGRSGGSVVVGSNAVGRNPAFVVMEIENAGGGSEEGDMDMDTNPAYGKFEASTSN